MLVSINVQSDDDRETTVSLASDVKISQVFHVVGKAFLIPKRLHST